MIIQLSRSDDGGKTAKGRISVRPYILSASAELIWEAYQHTTRRNTGKEVKIYARTSQRRAD